MNTMKDNKKSKTGFYMVLAVILAACLWIGWHDFDPWISQEAVRDNIRSGIRWTIQLAVQYFIPINILVYFVREIAIKRRASFAENRGGKFAHDFPALPKEK